MKASTPDLPPPQLPLYAPGAVVALLIPAQTAAALREAARKRGLTVEALLTDALATILKQE